MTFFFLTSRLAPGRTRRRPFAPTAAVFRLRDSESLALLRAFFLKMAANCGRRSWYSSRILFPKKMKRLDGSAKCFASYKLLVFLMLLWVRSDSCRLSIYIYLEAECLPVLLIRDILVRTRIRLRLRIQIMLFASVIFQDSQKNVCLLLFEATFTYNFAKIKIKKS